MAYKLEYLDELVKAAAPGGQATNFALSEIEITRILHEALEETDKIKVQLVQDVFNFTKEKEIEVYIKNYQIGCTHLLDRLYQQEQLLRLPDTTATNFYKSFYQSILSLLSFIEERFSKYFDRLEKVPDVYLALTKQEMRQKQAQIKTLLQGLQEEFVTIRLLEKLYAFVGDTSNYTATYRDIMFYKELVKELQDVSLWKKQANIYSGLQQLLVYLNYNAKEFINEMVNKIATELQGLDDLNDRIDKLLLYSKTLNQLQLKPDSALFFRHPSVKVQLSTWFSEELAYLEHILGGLQVKQKTDQSSNAKQKIVCKVPVDQLGIFFRAVSDLHLIATPSQKALFEQIAPWLSTTHRTILSPDSMRSKSYSPEKKDIEAVKDILMQLFRQAGKY